MDYTILIIKTCLTGGLFLLIFFGLFFRLLQEWFFQRRINRVVVTGKYPAVYAEETAPHDQQDFVIQVEAEGASLSLLCPGRLYSDVRVGDTVSLVCRGSRVKELLQI